MKEWLKTIFGIGAFLIFAALIGAAVMDTSFAKIKGTTSITGNVAAVTGGVQEVTLTFENYAYKLSPSRLQEGVPVRMVVDLDSVYGCMRDVVIPAFNVRKYVSEGDNVIEFTPTKSGTINIACSMNMGRGTFEVVSNDGQVADFVDTSAPEASAGSCGSSGGCGCGGTPA